ncbi:PREDICTED: arrestin domain-containing protein 2-like [Amphimedon queenslandica]|uniref:Arrestin C-terminal-like domain-containing protein n=1 Tax=Amphimedon queenslandica TaxID=400682 RepID=A0A1X7VQB9_AMPQE|nr:PREDICTED: arrestin domain-containing protein 2-like [Amphimedon queenslandica]|eukprot:XP_011409248.1 PREDICTED: arrestin domain-containing protein 2-like [Amphimedon queenslandica]
MKDFRMELKNPPNGIYFTGGAVTGTVIAVNDDQPKDYKAIQVRIVGAADVHWSEERGTGDDRHTVHYRAYEVYIDTFVNVWDRKTAGGGQFPVGNFQFPFSLQLGSHLPASYIGKFGRIYYKIEARVMKDGIFKRDTRCKTKINVGSVIPINTPQLRTPKAMEISKTLCCLCCASGPINITATVPRTGFCILKDAIRVEVSVENGSRRDVRQIVASFHKQVLYIAKRHHYCDIVTVASVASEPVAAHSSIVWRPPPIAVPNIPPTLINCNILRVTYHLTITASISGTTDPVIGIPITIGNVPLKRAPSGFPPQPQGTTAPPPAAGPPPAYPQPPPPTFAPTAPPAGGGFGSPADGSGFGPPSC